MLALTLNPGFVPILAALIVLATPLRYRPGVMAASAVIALWLLLDHEFGAAAAMQQMGLPVVLLNLDALNRIFGIALLIALIIVSLYAGSRRNRYADAAILTLAGSAVSALFVGDLVSFVAAAALGGLAAAWLVLASPLEGANSAGVRLLIWHGLEGLLFLVGVAFQLAAAAGGSAVARLDITSIGGAFIFAALMIRAGAPFAHVWLKDAIGHASPAGAAALSCFTTMLGVYALARMFPAEPLLTFIGPALIAIGVCFAAAEDDLRRAGAYALIAHTGICITLIGVGSPLALAAAEGHAFAAIFAVLALQSALGGVLERTGAASLAGMTGLARAMPVSALLIVGAGLAVAAAPGLALYATQMVALDATAQWDLRWLWLAIAATPAALFAGIALRPALEIYRATLKPRPFHEAPFTMLLGAGLSLFFCLSVGFAPQWLYGLMPADIAFQPFALDRLAPQLQLLGAAGVVYLALRAARATPKEQQLRLLDVDAFYRGPVHAAGRWAGVLVLRLYGTWQALTEQASETAGRWLGALARAFDRPYHATAPGLVPILALAGVLALMLLAK